MIMDRQIFTCTAGTAGYSVVVGSNAIHDLVKDASIGGSLGVSASTTVVIISDRNAWHFHGARIAGLLRQAGLRPIAKVLTPGEGSKTRATKEEIEDWMLQNRCLRDTLVIAIGGGVVGDLSGFVASTYMRGVPVVQVPTTLLAQVDSSIGGKTGLDTPAGKNLVGAFHAPRAVYVDTSLLATLPTRELSNGLAEVLKAGAICDPALFCALEECGEALLGEPAVGAYGVPCGEEGEKLEVGALQSIEWNAEGAPLPTGAIPVAARRLPYGPLTSVIARAIAVKVRVVSSDERESGERAILNFGHTVGHGIEAVLQPSWLHGECVAVGMVKEVEAARALGVAGADSALVARLKRVTKALGLPVTLPPSVTAGTGLDTALSHMTVDKKNTGASSTHAAVKCVLMSGVGVVKSPPYAHAVPLALLKRIMSAAVTVVPSAPGGAGPVRIRVPGSKSISNRALLLAGLAGGKTVIRGLLASDDTQVMMQCLIHMGASSRSVPDPTHPHAPPCLEVTGTGGVFTLPPVEGGGHKQLYVQNAGTASRFLASIVPLLPLHSLASGHSVVLAGNARMAVRPIGPLVDALRAQGAGVGYAGKEGCPPLVFTRGIDACSDSVTAGHAPHRPEGSSSSPGFPYRRRVVHLAAKLSSQYVSSILMAAPYFPAVRVGVEGRDQAQYSFDPTEPSCWVEVVLAEETPTSLPYITMTCAAMADFGVAVVKVADNVYLVPRTHYVPPASGLYDVEPDASSASYPAAWAVLARTPCVLEGVGSASTQGDAGFPALLGRMGAVVAQDKAETRICGPPEGGGLVGIDVDMANQTDCFMTLAAVAAVAAGTTRITGIANQRVKECNRIAAMVAELAKLGVHAWELPDGLCIEGTGLRGPPGTQDQGRGALHGALLHCYDDHRIAMSFSLLGSVVPGITLDDAACVDKTFPEWWDVLDGRLGCRVEGAGPSAPPVHPQAQPLPLPVHTLVIIGMRGAGKSSLAAAAAAGLGRAWTSIDLDRVLEAEAGQSCAGLVQAQGWEAFRAAEARVLGRTLGAAVAPGTGRVIACGGGVVESESCRVLLCSVGEGVRVVHVDRQVRDIEADLEKAVEAGADAGRPAYAAGASLADTAARRAPLYASCSTSTFHILAGERDWMNVNARFTARMRSLAGPLPLLALVQAATHPYATTDTAGPGALPASSSFLCLACADVRECVRGASEGVGPGSGQAWDEVAQAMHAIAADSDAVELRVDCLRLPDLSDAAGVLAACGTQMALLRAGLARGAALALAGEQAGRIMPSIIPKPIIFTVRSRGEGGRFDGNEAEYASLCRAGLRVGADWLDVEAGRAGAGGILAPASALALAAEARAIGCRVISSAHWPCDPSPSRGDLEAAAARAWRDGAGGDVLKLVAAAASPQDALRVQADIGHVRHALAERASSLPLPGGPFLPPPTVGIAMGGQGVLTRALNDVWTPVTHARLPTPAAPGQLSIAQCRALRASTGVLTPSSYFLFGKPVAQSLSPALHNAGFAALGLPHRYGLVETEDAAHVDAIVRGAASPHPIPPYEGRGEAAAAWAASSFPTLVAGGSVTMPVKQTVLPYCDWLGPAAAAIGAVNVLTVVRRQGGVVHVCGDNTDWVGVYQPVRDALAGQGRKGLAGGEAMLIVGAGGTCLAVAYAARALGLRVLVANRTLTRSADVVSALHKGGQTDAVALGLDAQGLEPAALLALYGVSRVAAIVCTLPPSVGWTAPPSLLTAHTPVVLDVAYRPRHTPLLDQARTAGCPAIEGVQMLIAQGLAAFALWTGKVNEVGVQLAGSADAGGDVAWGPGVPVPEMAAAVYKLLEKLPVLQ